MVRALQTAHLSKRADIAGKTLAIGETAAVTRDGPYYRLQFPAYLMVY
jgi:hypothetical protein